MAYVVTAQKPTNVTHSLRGRFTSPSDDSLIVVKSSRVELHSITPAGLSPILEAPLFGRVSAAELFTPPGEAQAHLFLATEHCQFCVLKYDPERGLLNTVAQGDVRDRIGRATERGHIGIIDDA